MTEAPEASGIPTPSFKRERVADGVTTYLRNMILTGTLKAGQHLRVEHLAAQLELSVTPIRESLLELLGEGYVAREPHRGYVVAELTRDGLADQVLVLALISGELAARAAEHAASAQLSALRTVQGELIDADRRGDRRGAEAANHQFHVLINKTADSPRLAWNAQRNSNYVPRYTFESLGWVSTCNYDHDSVLKALDNHDLDAARQAMVAHITESGESLGQALEANGFWALVPRV